MILFSAIPLFSASIVSGQHLNAHQFIKPNISISYDSNLFTITDPRSHENGETAFLDFKLLTDTVNSIVIRVKADHPIEFTTKQMQDSFMLTGLQQIEQMEDETFTIVNRDKHVRTVHEFSCVGFARYDKVNKKYASIISCYHISNQDNTIINMVTDRNDFDADYKLITQFLSGFRSYSEKEFDEANK